MNSYAGGNFILHRDGRPALVLSDGVGIEKMKPIILSFIQDYSDVNKMVQLNLGTNAFNYKGEMDEFDKTNLRFSSIYVKNLDEFYEKINSELKKIMFQTGMTPNIYLAGMQAFVETIYSGLEQSGLDKVNIIVGQDDVDAGCDGGCGSCGQGC